MPDFLRSALKNKIFWYLASRYGTFAIQFLTSIWLAVKLGPYYFGLWSFILLLVNIGSQINFGIANALSILLVQNKKDVNLCKLYEYNGLLLTLLISVVPFAIVIWDSIWPIPLFVKYDLGRFSYAVALIVICFHLNSLCINVFRIKNKLFEIAISQSMFPVMSFTLVLLFSREILLNLLVGGYVVTSIFSLLLFLRQRVVGLNGEIDVCVTMEIMRKGGYLFLYNACFLLTMLSTKMLISMYYPVEIFGQFAFAFNVANATILLIDSLMFLLFPKMIDMLKGDNHSYIREKIALMRNSYIFTMNILFYFMMGVFGVLVKFLPKYGDAFPIFVSIAITMLVYVWCFGYAIYMLAQNQEHIMAVFSCGMLLLNIVCVWLLIRIFHVGVEMCIAGTAFSYFVYVLCVNGCSRHRMDVISNVVSDCVYVCRLGVFPAVLAILLMYLHLSIWVPCVVLCVMIGNVRILAQFVVYVRHLILRPQIMNV